MENKLHKLSSKYLDYNENLNLGEEMELLARYDPASLFVRHNYGLWKDWRDVSCKCKIIFPWKDKDSTISSIT